MKLLIYIVLPNGSLMNGKDLRDSAEVKQSFPQSYPCFPNRHCKDIIQYIEIVPSIFLAKMIDYGILSQHGLLYFMESEIQENLSLSHCRIS